MKSTSATAFLALIASAALWAGAAAAAECTSAPGATTLAVHVEGVRVATGDVTVTVYPDDPKRFLAPKSKLARERPTATMPETTACFTLPGPGYYAVAVYHDANGDNKFGRTLVGLPAEGFGFSNDPSTLTGLPSFKSVRFKVGPGETQLPVKLRYLK